MEYIASHPELMPHLSFFMGDQVYLDVPPTEVVGSMGERGVRNDDATDDDIAAMRAIVAEAARRCGAVLRS